MILMSLPNTYTTHLETLADMAISSGCMFTAHDFISKVTELVDKQQLWATRDPKSIQKDSVLHMSDGHKKGKKTNTSKGTLNASTVTKKGHFAHHCCGPGEPRKVNTPQKGRLPKAVDSTANTTVPVHDSAWSAVAFRLPAINEGTYLNETPIMIKPSHPVMSANAMSSATLTGAITSELYDSGATQHMTYKDALVNYEVIAPKPINAANQQTFWAI